MKYCTVNESVRLIMRDEYCRKHGVAVAALVR
jgi:hypothetical protein